MLLVEAEVRPSSIHGLGLFSLEYIAAGRAVWTLDETKCLKLDRAQFEALMASRKDELTSAFEKFAFVQNDESVVMDLDDTRHINHHATNFNLKCSDPKGTVMVATRDVYPGEELLENYAETIGNRSLCASFLSAS